MLYIFEIKVKENYTAKQYADAWFEASKQIQALPGAKGTRLHRKIDSPDTLLAIATWASKEARDFATQSYTRDVANIISAQSPFVTIRVIGEFEDAEWEVVPKKYRRPKRNESA